MSAMASENPRRAAAVRAAGAKSAELDNIVQFRRGGGVRPLRRSPLRKWLRPFLTAAAIVGLPAAAVAWTLTSPRFAVQEIVVDSGPRASERWVREALQPLLGSNLPLLSLAHAEAVLHRHPWVLRADLRKVLPSRLSVRVTEKRAVALLRRGSELHYLDIEGTPIAPFDPLAGHVDLLLISRAAALGSGDDSGRGSVVAAAVHLAEEIANVAPRWSAGLSEIVILGEEDFRIYTDSLPFPLLVRAGTLQTKARRLEALLPQIVERYGTEAAIDLRFTRRIIVQPSVRVGPASVRSRPAAAYREAALDHVQHG